MIYSLFNQVLILDSKIDHWVKQIQTPLRTKLMIMITTLGSPLSLFFISFVWVGYMRNRQTIASALILSFALWAGMAVALSIKSVTKRARPQNGLVTLITLSFPSAHAMISTIFFGFLISSIPVYIASPFESFLFIICCLVAILSISASRIYLQAHRLSDVVGGIILGIILLSLMQWLL